MDFTLTTVCGSKTVVFKVAIDSLRPKLHYNRVPVMTYSVTDSLLRFHGAYTYRPGTDTTSEECGFSADDGTISGVGILRDSVVTGKWYISNYVGGGPLGEFRLTRKTD